VRSDWRDARAALRIVLVGLGISFDAGCGPGADFQTFMRTPLPGHVTVRHMDGNWGAEPWRCWEIYPADQDLKRTLVTTWKLVPNPKAFNGVASGEHIYCRYDNLSESYSGESDSYRAVGIDATKNVMLVYFYNG
jgi:hypothetical protein